MKTYLKHSIIILFLLLAELGAFSLKAHSQEFGLKPDTSTVLLADETTLSFTKNEAKIETYNDKIFIKLFIRYSQFLTHFTAHWKVDKRGNPYKQYLLYINKEDANTVIEWTKTNL